MFIETSTAKYRQNMNIIVNASININRNIMERQNIKKVP